MFSDYKRLDYFDVSNNLLTGRIPPSLFEIPTIRLVYMSNCSLSGTIPRSYSDPPLLRDLYLDGNEISGPVPSFSAGKLTNLNEFLLHRTKITGSMPESVCNLRENFILDDLWADCGGSSPEIDCDFPNCCNRCFENS